MTSYHPQIRSQIKGTAAYIKQGIAKEIKICLVDPKTEEVKEVYKFSQKSLAEDNAENINPKLKQKRLLDMIEGNFERKNSVLAFLSGFFQKIDKEMATFEVKLT